MNDRNRWGGPRYDRSEDFGRQQASTSQHEQWSDDGWRGAPGGGRGGAPRSGYQAGYPSGQQGGQQGGWHDESSAGDDRGQEWRGSRDWGEPRSDRPGMSDPAMGGSRHQGDDGDRRRGGERAWAERAWGGSSLREGDRGLGSAAGDGRNRWGDRDDVRCPGSQSFASGYGMGDGPRTDFRGYAQPGAGSSAPGFGRGYGPDYGRDDDRGFLARAGDQIAAWFGDDDAQERRDRDMRESHRGRGPGDYTRSDDRIREDVNDRLTDDHHVDARRISLKVEQGEVTLSGTVPDRDSKRRAEDVAERISGVRHVQNNLRIALSAELGQSGSSAYSGEPLGTATPASAGATGTAGSTAGGSSGTGATGGSATGAATGSGKTG